MKMNELEYVFRVMELIGQSEEELQTLTEVLGILL